MQASVSRGLVALVLIGAPAQALAHQVWLEQDGKTGRLCFGEYAENMRERSPGRLDKFGKLTATLLGPPGSDKPDKPIELRKAADGFVLSTRAGKGESIIALDPGYPLLSRKPGGPGAKPGDKASDKPTVTLWTPAARFVSDLGAREPKLPLDIVPTGQPEEFQVVFRGKPLPEAKIDIAIPAGWAREASTDKDGKVRFALPWKGGYLIKVHHADPTPGKRKTDAGEEPYDAGSYSTSLAFVTSKGLPAPAAPPAQAPSEPEVAAKK